MTTLTLDTEVYCLILHIIIIKLTKVHLSSYHGFVDTHFKNVQFDNITYFKI